MKTALLLCLVLTLPAGLRSEENGLVRIDEIGTQGLQIPNFPTPVRVHIAPLKTTQTIRLIFRVSRNRDFRTDEFQLSVLMNAGEPLEIEAPIPLPGWFGTDRAVPILSVIAQDAGGHELGETKSRVPSF